MELIRTFIAVTLSEDIKQEIKKTQNELKQLTDGVRWVMPERLHVTLKFLGGVKKEQISDITSAVSKCCNDIQPFNLLIKGLGVFPNINKARIIWAGIDEGFKPLSQLAILMDEEFSKLGFENEQKPFKAHITLGRVTDFARLDKFASGIKAYNEVIFGSEVVKSITVMKSEIHREGPIYTPLDIIYL